MYDFSFPSQSDTDFSTVEPNKLRHDFGFLLSSLFISSDRNTLLSYLTFSTTYIIKAQNRGMKEDKYAKILAKKQVCADISYARYSEMETPCWYPFEGHKYVRRKPTETSVFEFSY